MKRFFFILMLVASLPLPSFATSFNCENKLTLIENAICKNAKLGELNEEMNSLYQIISKKQIKIDSKYFGYLQSDYQVANEDKNIEKVNILQKKWLFYRDAACKNSHTTINECLKQFYYLQIRYLTNYPKSVISKKRWSTSCDPLPEMCNHHCESGCDTQKEKYLEQDAYALLFDALKSVKGQKLPNDKAHETMSRLVDNHYLSIKIKDNICKLTDLAWYGGTGAGAASASCKKSRTEKLIEFYRRYITHPHYATQ